MPLNIVNDDVITGHINVVQIRGGYINILDYKPNATKTKLIQRLIIYALSLSHLMVLPLKLFKCAWLNNQSYFVFYPLWFIRIILPASPLLQYKCLSRDLRGAVNRMVYFKLIQNLLYNFFVL